MCCQRESSIFPGLTRRTKRTTKDGQQPFDQRGFLFKTIQNTTRIFLVNLKLSKLYLNSKLTEMTLRHVYNKLESFLMSNYQTRFYVENA